MLAANTTSVIRLCRALGMAALLLCITQLCPAQQAAPKAEKARVSEKKEASTPAKDDDAKQHARETAIIERINRRIGDWIELEETKRGKTPKLIEQKSGSVTFFGMTGQGTRFVFVLDRSGSMGDPGGLPIRAAKRELITSLDQLSEMQQCYVLFYNEDVRVLNPTGVAGRLVYASEPNKRALARLVERVSPDGATDHMVGLRQALALRPDVIFLLTDGDANDDLTEADLAKITRFNSSRASIYVVQFGPEQEGNRLELLAEQNGGQHKYVDILREGQPAEAK